MIGRTNSGSGASKVFAAISVNYPVGSTCICTDGVRTLKLKDTSGQDFFLVPYAATWTVSCYDGVDYNSSENKTSKTIEITSKWQNIKINLNYDLLLYKSGEGAIVTFSTARQSNASVNINTDAIITNYTSSEYNQIACVTPKIDLTGFTRFSIIANCTKIISSTDYKGILGVFKKTTTAAALKESSNSDAIIIAKKYFSVKNGEFDLDLTGINGEYLVGIKGCLKSTISEIRLIR